MGIYIYLNYAEDVMQRFKLHIWSFRGGDARTHNLPLTVFYKGNFAQILCRTLRMVIEYL